MIRCGMVDFTKPITPSQPILPVCPRCNEKDAACPSCGGRGRFRVEQDPRQTVPASAFRIAAMADLYFDHGLPPIGGGQMDQSNWFLDAAMFCVSDRERMIAQRYGQA